MNATDSWCTSNSSILAVILHVDGSCLFKEISDEFTVKVANTPKEITALLEVEFEYVLTKDGVLFFRKRK